MNVIQQTHAFLLTHCDGLHANRFARSLVGHPFDANTAEGLARFNSLSEAEQVTFIVNYWAAQFSLIGIGATEELIAGNVAFILTNSNGLALYMQSLVPFIEDNELPIVSGG